MTCVFPGLDEIRASPLMPQSILMSEDFPTFERPMNAYSGLSGFGHCESFTPLLMYFAEVIFTNQM